MPTRSEAGRSPADTRARPRDHLVPLLFPNVQYYAFAICWAAWDRLLGSAGWGVLCLWASLAAPFEAQRKGHSHPPRAAPRPLQPLWVSGPWGCGGPAKARPPALCRHPASGDAGGTQGPVSAIRCLCPNTSALSVFSSQDATPFCLLAQARNSGLILDTAFSFIPMGINCQTVSISSLNIPGPYFGTRCSHLPGAPCRVSY